MPRPTMATDDPAEALALLAEGNARFVAGTPRSAPVTPEELALEEGQSPFAIVLGCSDSRVPIEMIFDQQPGHIFVVRVAGNFLNADNLASIEFAVQYLKSKIVVVLGHTHCGALTGAVNYAKSGTELPGHINNLIVALGPRWRRPAGFPATGSPTRSPITSSVMRARSSANPSSSPPPSRRASSASPLDSMISERAASPSRSGRLKSAVAFVCERLSLAVVAVGTVFMILVFVAVEDNATQLGTFPVILLDNSNEVQAPPLPNVHEVLKDGDRIDLSLLSPQQRFELVRGAKSGTKMTLMVTRGGRRFPKVITASSPDYTPRAKFVRDVGIPLCFFLSLGLASALFLMRPRPITLAFYIYTILMLLKVNKAALDLAIWPINLRADLLIQVVFPLAQLMILVFAARLYGVQTRAWRWLVGTAIFFAIVDFLVWMDPIIWMVFQQFQLPGPTNR